MSCFCNDTQMTWDAHNISLNRKKRPHFYFAALEKAQSSSWWFRLNETVRLPWPPCLSPPSLVKMLFPWNVTPYRDVTPTDVAPPSFPHGCHSSLWFVTLYLRIKPPSRQCTLDGIEVLGICDQFSCSRIVHCTLWSEFQAATICDAFPLRKRGADHELQGAAMVTRKHEMPLTETVRTRPRNKPWSFWQWKSSPTDNFSLTDGLHMIKFKKQLGLKWHSNIIMNSNYRTVVNLPQISPSLNDRSKPKCETLCSESTMVQMYRLVCPTLTNIGRRDFAGSLVGRWSFWTDPLETAAHIHKQWHNIKDKETTDIKSKSRLPHPEQKLSGVLGEKFQEMKLQKRCLGFFGCSLSFSDRGSDASKEISIHIHLNKKSVLYLLWVCYVWVVRSQYVSGCVPWDGAAFTFNFL